MDENEQIKRPAKQRRYAGIHKARQIDLGRGGICGFQYPFTQVDPVVLSARGSSVCMYPWCVQHSE